MPMARVGDINIHYDIHGEGDPLLLISGYTSPSGGWFMQIPAFSKEYRAIPFDNRGTGLSDAPDYASTMEMMANDAVGLLDALGIGTAHVCGVSMGGAIAQNLVILHPQRVRGLILACTGCGGTLGINGNPEVLKQMVSPVQQSSPVSGNQASDVLSTMLSQHFMDNNPDIMRKIAAIQVDSPTPPITFRNHSLAMRTHDTYDRLPEIQAPTLVISGDADVIVPVENSRILAERIPNAELAILEGMGHCFKWEAADEFNRRVLGFLKRNP